MISKHIMFMNHTTYSNFDEHCTVGKENIKDRKKLILSNRECEITKQILLSIQCFPCQCAGAIRVRKVPRVFEPREGIIIRHFGPLSSWKTVQCSLFSLFSYLLFKVFVVTLFSGILSMWGILSTLWL